MASVTIAGDTSGSVTLSAPAVAGTTTLTLPSTSGTVITTGSSGQIIPKAALPAGAVLQVVNATRPGASVSTTSTSDVSFGATATITPTSSSSKIYVIASGAWYLTTGTSTEYAISIQRNGTTIPNANNDGLTSAYGVGDIAGSYVMTILDSPATTSATTYLVVAHRINPGTCTLYNAVRASQQNVITLMEIAA